MNTSNLTSLKYITINYTSLVTLDLSDNLELKGLWSGSNLLSELDLSLNTQLRYISISGLNLNTLNIKNGNNTNITLFNVLNNPSLECIQVDDINYSNSNWSSGIDAQTSFSEDCRYDDTYVPDDNFEQALINLGYDSGTLDDYVPTSNITSVTYLNFFNKNISDLPGIEDFTNLDELKCRSNNLTSLNLSENTLLTEVDCSLNDISSLSFDTNPLLERLHCFSNYLTALDVTNNGQLEYLNCANNDINSLDVANNIELSTLFCFQNDIVNLDVSRNPNLNILYCIQNNLKTLNVKNGNNSNMAVFYAYSNPKLKCIQVDDVAYSQNNWTNINPHARFNTNCLNGFPFFRQQDISIYPNPTEGNISIQSSRPGTLFGIEIYNTLGIQMKINTKNNNSLDLSHLPNDNYIVVLNYGEERVSKMVYKE